jgi:putative polyketide hydroxylase
VLDEVLLAAARRRGADVRFGCEVVDVAQDPDGVDVTLLDRDGGRRRRIRADHLVVADGAGGRTRELLGIPVSGPGPLGPPLVNILFRADLRELVDGREFLLCEVANDEVEGMLIAIGGDRWVLHIPAEEVGADRCVELVRAATGVPDLAVEVLNVLSWRAAARVADRFREGRAFLVGDAAHVAPPAGAFGLNTGIADAHNLAWKLAMVGRGQAGPGLLDTYDAERRPVARFTMDQALLRVRFPELHWNPSLVEERARHGVANPLVVGLGYRYASSAVIGGLPAPSLEDVALDGTPGSRVPHAWLERDGARQSTLDVTGTGFGLLAGPDGGAWCEAAAGLGEDLVARRIEGVWSDAAGVGPAGALLVRPDRFVAWRATTPAPPDAAGRLRAVLDEVLSRGGRRRPASARAGDSAAPA